ncbi:MAG: ferredoxin [Candidatus Diapherotrites archaeon]
MPGFKIVHARDKCIGCGSCAGICPGNWEMAADGKSRPKKILLEEEGCNRLAEESCPAKCIHLQAAE